MLSKQTQLPDRAIRAHAIKNCLAVVSAVNRLLEPQVGEAERQRLSRSQNAVARLLELIDEDLVRSDDVLAQPANERVTARHVLSTVRAQVEDLARARGVRLSFVVGTGSVSGDVRELVEALLNIVMNAIDSSPPAGIVVVTSRARADGGQLWTVEDEGAGIPKQLLARVGTPFLSRRQGGSGLGVAVARDTVERHGGRLGIQSAPGLGTLVSIHLPGQLTATPSALGAPRPAIGSQGDQSP
jgi:signal transduction histidine kinase